MNVCSVGAMDEPTTLAMNIRAALGDRSESWLAAETGIPQQTLNRWLKDPAQISVRALVRIANALETTTSALWTGEAA